MEILSILQSAGLSEKEARLFLSSSELRDASLAVLCKHSGIPRSTAEYLLGKLVQRGLVTEVKHGVHARYSANSPKAIIRLLEKEQSQATDRLEAFKTALPELRQLQASYPFMPKVRFYEGSEVRRIYDEMLEAPIDEVLFVTETENYVELLGERYLADWIKERVKRHIRARCIYAPQTDNSALDAYSVTNSAELRTTRFAPSDFRCPASIDIYGDNVVVLGGDKEKFATVTTSRIYATTMKGWFNQLWKVSTEK